MRKTKLSKDKFPISKEDLKVFKTYFCADGKRIIEKLIKNPSKYKDILNLKYDYVYQFINDRCLDIFVPSKKDVTVSSHIYSKYERKINNIRKRCRRHWDYRYSEGDKFKFTDDEITTILNYTKEQIKHIKFIYKFIKAFEKL